MKYIIRWNTGYGDSIEVIEANSHAEAEAVAYEAWHEDVQSHADFEALEYDEETWENMQ